MAASNDHVPGRQTRGEDALRIVVDHRETGGGLVDALRSRWSELAVGHLTVGDVRIGRRIGIERKTVADLVRSVADGRLHRQLYALCGEVVRPLLVIEGAEAIEAAGIRAASLRGVLLSAAVGHRVPMLRTMDVFETATWIAAIADQERRRLRRRRPPASRPPGPLEILAAVPGVGDVRAAALVRAFGSVQGVLTASPEALRAVPGVGPDTVEAIDRALGGSDNG